ncbi:MULTISPECIES: ISKra4 family transposase [Roseobacteraceae]|jgi:hypothetical protein|uniref:ISKra4 family transposase n=1 Tax=Marivita cryptomonadis TaxID=505252 RepID=A0A9Q2S2E0_9RHOB|nr:MULTISPECIES: ISKra4 family transposase [Roseobacteraceae]MBM2324373.1 ISKra4 family transposase [Marivita cryptomonadis]MBM2333965.1 ISKra4 family transposase [Marivita cryptomonadis]MBM2343539.1 ISKra4 family transposase [Marivita cryptomonadis]MBM2348216.1 ISKra4 family transposase [Marivita cryptomonadis]MBM2352894.1 ISKra4 family transposase [Marivita cryptomonadis]
MDVQISMETTFDDGTRRTHRLGDLSRPYRLTNSEALGLLLSDAKAIISQIQRAILTDQLEEVVAVNRTCSACGSTKSIHDYRTRVFDTAFGRFRHQVPRLKQCKCGVAAGYKCRGEQSPVAKIFPDRATPELCRLQTELGSRHSFREAARIMETFLPCAKQINTTVRNRLGRVAQSFIDREPAQISVDEDAQSPPLTVFLDGAHIRCRPEYQKRHLDVVVGKVESPNMCRRFGLVAQAGPSPSGQLRQDLLALGWDGQRPVTVISDGEPALPNLIRAAVDGRVRHILDWWHISMRVQHIENAVKGLLQTESFTGFPELFKRPAETLRWCLWHGKIMTAGTRLKLLMIDSGRVTTEDAAVRAAAARVEARCRELYTYLGNNWDALTNYGWRHRNGFSISSSRAEGCVDDIGNARMGKSRRMRWSPRGAHNVAVTRAAVLDGRLSVSHQEMAA